PCSSTLRAAPLALSRSPISQAAVSSRSQSARLHRVTLGHTKNQRARPHLRASPGHGLMSDDGTSALHSDEETAKLALAAADAIKRLVADRAALRNRLTAREAELAHLRQHVDLIRDNYRRLASELVTQLEVVDRLDHEVAKETDQVVEFPRF